MSYDAFATTFSNSRKNLHWPELEYIIADMMQYTPDSILDIGCGNGRFLDWFGNPPIGDFEFTTFTGRVIAKQWQEGVSSETPLFEGGRGESVSVKDIQGFSHRLPYNRENTERARELRKNMSAPEKENWHQFLKHQDIRWYRQYPIDNFIVDFYCPAIRLIIEIDGESHLETKKYDIHRTSILGQYGLRIIRFTNRDIMIHLEGVCEKIKTTPPCPPQIGGSSKKPSQSETNTINYLGIDSSEGMISEARKLHPNHHFDICSMLALQTLQHSNTPTFDTLLFLASFHHLESRIERVQVLLDSKKLINPNGRIYMTNWNLRDQEKYETSHRGDGDYDIKIGAYSRYYHGFTVDELRELFEETGYQVVENRIFDGGRNFLSILQLKNES